MESNVAELRQLQAAFAVLRYECHQKVRKLTHKVKVLERRGGSTSNFTLGKLIIVIPCVLGSLYQAYQITEVYLKYDVIAESLFYPAEAIVAPMVTICCSDSFKQKCKDDCLRNSTTLFDAIYPFEQAARVIGFFKPGEDYESIGMSMEYFTRHFVTTYTINNMACYAIDFASNFTTNYTFMDARADPASVILQIYLNGETCKGCHGYVTRVGNLNVKSFTGKPLEQNRHVKLSYQKQELNLLPKPYTTKCYDYSKIGVYSQEECIAKFEKIYTQKTNMTNLKAFVPVKKGEDVMISYGDTKPFSWSRSQCMKAPCRLEQFYVYDSFKSEEYGNDTVISLMFPENGELTVNYKPKITLWEFLTLFGSVFGLWFGVTGLAISNLFLDGILKSWHSLF